VKGRGLAELRTRIRDVEQEVKNEKPPKVCIDDGLVSFVSAWALLEGDKRAVQVGRKVSHERVGYIRYSCCFCRTPTEATELRRIDDGSKWTHECPSCGASFQVLWGLEEPDDFGDVPVEG